MSTAPVTTISPSTGGIIAQHTQRDDAAIEDEPELDHSASWRRY